VLDGFNEPLPPLKDFILPGGGMAAATCCHLARTVCRRAEREVIALAHVEDVRPQAQRYLNRLSDLLFVICRVLARASGHGEVLWQHERRRKPNATNSRRPTTCMLRLYTHSACLQHDPGVRPRRTPGAPVGGAAGAGP
jgi:hypothetical protein